MFVCLKVLYVILVFVFCSLFWKDGKWVTTWFLWEFGTFCGMLQIVTCHHFSGSSILFTLWNNAFWWSFYVYLSCWMSHIFQAWSFSNQCKIILVAMITTQRLSNLPQGSISVFFYIWVTYNSINTVVVIS